MKEFGVDLNWKINVKIYLSTLAARRLPGSIIHVLGRVSLYKLLGQSLKRIALASALEYILIVWSGVILTILFTFINFHIIDKFWILILIGLVIFMVTINPKFINFLLNKLNREEYKTQLNYWKILYWLIGYSIIWLLGGFFLILIIYTINSDLKFLWYQSVLPWISSGIIGMIITFLPSGLGVVEITLSSYLSKFVGISIALSAALLSRIIQTFIDVIISFLFLLLNKLCNPKELLK
ncbi:MAG: hypothetical protein Q7U53_14435 [Anaerolineaceae bacterium]|nr:hypothetical protein [Anaerolineaceae bacterium]